MYERLKDLQWHTTEECVEAVGHRFGASVLLLRKEGYDIRSEREDDKWVYRMMSLEKGPELGSKVKMYLTMDSVIALANGNITEHHVGGRRPCT